MKGIYLRNQCFDSLFIILNVTLYSGVSYSLLMNTDYFSYHRHMMPNKHDLCVDCRIYLEPTTLITFSTDLTFERNVNLLRGIIIVGTNASKF